MMERKASVLPIISGNNPGLIFNSALDNDMSESALGKTCTLFLSVDEGQLCTM